MHCDDDFPPYSARLPSVMAAGRRKRGEIELCTAASASASYLQQALHGMSPFPYHQGWASSRTSALGLWTTSAELLGRSRWQQQQRWLPKRRLSKPSEQRVVKLGADCARSRRILRPRQWGALLPPLCPQTSSRAGVRHNDPPARCRRSYLAWLMRSPLLRRGTPSRRASRDGASRGNVLWERCRPSTMGVVDNVLPLKRI